MDKKIVPIGGGSGVNMADVFNAIYPVGSLYWNENPISPAELFGGEWERIKDRFILAAGDSYEAGSEGGAATVALGIPHIPSHAHSRGTMNIKGNLDAVLMDDGGSITADGAFSISIPRQRSWSGIAGDAVRAVSFDASRSWTGETSLVGNGEAHNNMPPYIVAYCWKRIA